MGCQFLYARLNNNLNNTVHIRFSEVEKWAAKPQGTKHEQQEQQAILPETFSWYVFMVCAFWHGTVYDSRFLCSSLHNTTADIG